MAALSDQAVSASWRSWTHSSGGGDLVGHGGHVKDRQRVPTRRSTLAAMRVRTRSPKPRRPRRSGCRAAVGHGGDEHQRRRPGRRARRTAPWPSEWAITAWAGPWAAATAARASANRGRCCGRALRTGVGVAVAGGVEATTRKPAATSGRRRRPAASATRPSRGPGRRPAGRPVGRAAGGSFAPDLAGDLAAVRLDLERAAGGACRSWRPCPLGTVNQSDSPSGPRRRGRPARAGRMTERSCFLDRCAAGGHLESPQSAGRTKRGGRPPPAPRRRGCAGGGVGVVEQPAGVVVGQHRPVQVVGELGGVGVGAEVALGDAGAEHLGDRVQPVALVLGQPVTHGAWLGVELGAGGDEQAAAGQGLGVPGEPAPEQLAHPGLAAGGGQGGADHQVDEAGPGGRAAGAGATPWTGSGRTGRSWRAGSRRPATRWSARSARPGSPPGPPRRARPAWSPSPCSWER